MNRRHGTAQSKQSGNPQDAKDPFEAPMASIQATSLPTSKPTRFWRQ